MGDGSFKGKLLVFNDSSSDEEEEELFDDLDEFGRVYQLVEAEGSGTRRPRGSVPGHQVLERDHAAGHERILANYFVENPVYTDYHFRRRFRMRRHVFLRIMQTVEEYDPWFKQRPNCTGKLGLSALQKCVAAIRILAYGVPADAVDEYVKIGESMANMAVNRFCLAVVNVFQGVYLRAPTPADVARLLEVGQRRGFPGMLGSLDCMHWDWKNCPTAWKGMFTGRGKSASMILEAVASYDLWIWHAYFGMPESNNDINVLHRSPLFFRYADGDHPPVSFNVNGHTYNMGYYLTDGIYPEWLAFVKSVRYPLDMKSRHFARVQESTRKDIERAFGVLQSWWAIVRGPSYGWNRELLKNIMMACVIMHNMIVEDENGELPISFDYMGTLVESYRLNSINDFIAAHHRLRNKQIHEQLRMDLIEHNWMSYGGH